MDSLNILFVAQLVPGSRSRQRVAALREIGCRVRCISTVVPGDSYETVPSVIDRIRYRLRRPGDPASANAQIVEIAAKEQFDVIWLDRAVIIKSQTLATVRASPPAPRVIWYAEDDMMNPVHRTRWVDSIIPHVDLWVTTKSYNAQPHEVPALGARRVMFVNNAYDPKLHAPARISEDERAGYRAQVGFVGTYEKPRADSLLFLAENGIAVRVWGNGWGHLKHAHDNLIVEDRPVYEEEYGKVVAATDINLCFLRKGNRDLQTCRSIELPAFSAFMLHERNNEICALFREDREAAYFESNTELLSQCRRWLEDEKGRDTVAGAARLRVIEARHSHIDRMRDILGALDAHDMETPSETAE